jgi:hypothetical protein
MCHSTGPAAHPHGLPSAAKGEESVPADANDLEAMPAGRYKSGVPASRSPFFGTLPERGPWTALGLTRGQFAAILGLSLLLFVFVGGPLWSHLRESHLTRITVSYGVIPPAVVVALRRNGSARPGLVLGASAAISLVKLVLTAALLVAVALAR